ncbi:MAG: hypothetical protein HYV35_03915 [Lentisphaerae bacterium]|nr:hypothetical protein [Lentisphaerota bacterium]
MSCEPETGRVLASFRLAKAEDRLAHAYLLVGAPRGAAGMLAERIVALLYCTAATQRPCGQCAKCAQAAAHTLADALWVEPQKKSRGILIEQIAAVQEHINLTAFEGGWKAVVLLFAERLNREAANHFLKTLEEPPAKCLFLLLSDQPAALPPTVRSRCQRVVLPAEERFAGSELRAAVIAAMTAIEGRTVIAALARARQVLAVLKQVRDAIEAKVDQEQSHTKGQDEPEASEEIYAARLEGLYKEAVAQLFYWLLLWQRDVLRQVVGAGAAAAGAFPEQAAAIKQQAATLTYSAALANVYTIEDMRWQVEQHLSVATVLERGFIRLTAVVPEDRRRTPRNVGQATDLSRFERDAREPNTE